MYDPLIVDAFIEVHAQIAPPTESTIPATNKEGLSAITRSLSPSETVSSGSGLEDIAASTEEMLVLYDLARSLTGHVALGDAADIISNTYGA